MIAKIIKKLENGFLKVCSKFFWIIKIYGALSNNQIRNRNISLNVPNMGSANISLLVFLNCRVYVKAYRKVPLNVNRLELQQPLRYMVNSNVRGSGPSQYMPTFPIPLRPGQDLCYAESTTHLCACSTCKFSAFQVEFRHRSLVTKKFVIQTARFCFCMQTWYLWLWPLKC